MPTNGTLLVALLDQERAQIHAEEQVMQRHFATRKQDHLAKRRLLALLLGPAAAAIGLRPDPEPDRQDTTQET